MANGGRIIFTASIQPRFCKIQWPHCASKHATLGFMRSMANELGPRGIRVNAVCPGWVRTDASMRSLQDMALDTNRDQQDRLPRSSVIG